MTLQISSCVGKNELDAVVEMKSYPVKGKTDMSVDTPKAFKFRT